MSNRELPMMPWYPDQFAASTRTWTFLERAIYRALLDVQWAIDALPHDEASLARACGVSAREFRKAWRTVSSKFQKIEGGGLQNFRLEQHRLAAFERHRTRSEAGRSGALARIANAKQASSSASSIARNLPGAKPNPPSPSPSPSPDKNSVPPERLLPGDRAATLRTSVGKINKNGHGRQRIEEPEDQRLHKALQLLQADPEFPLHKLADMYHLSVEAIREARHR